MKSKTLFTKKVLSALLALSFVLRCLPTSIFAAPETEYRNIALGRSYTMSHQPNASYGDAGGELTDDKIGGVNFYDSKWVGWSLVPTGTLANVTIDLGSVKEFEDVECVVLDMQAPSIFYPAGDIIISYSDTENGTYKEFARNAVPDDAPKDSVYTLTFSGEPVSARYVRVEFNARTWSFFSEIRVFGNVSIEPELPVISMDLPENLDKNEGDKITLSAEASVTDGGVLSYQWYKDGVALDGETSRKLVINSATEADTGLYYLEITNFFNSLTKTVKTKSCNLVVFPGGLVINDPVIDTDLDASVLLTFKDKLELKVEASNTDSGTLSYQWYKDGVKIGTDSNTYVVDSAKIADSGVYSVVVTNTVDEIYKKSVTSAECVVTVATVERESIISGMAYTTNVPDGRYADGGGYHNTYTDPDHRKLTDGKFGTSWQNVNNAGFHNTTEGYVEIVYDFSEEKPVKEIQLSGFANNAAGIKVYQYIKVEALIDGEWLLLHNITSQEREDGKVIDVLAVPDDVAFSVKSLKITIADFGAWLFMDEIEVFSELTGETPTANLKIIKENNVAKDATYEYSREDDWGYYPDTGNKELNDGRLGGITYTDKNWVGYSGAFYIIFDLGERTTFSEVKAVMLNNPDPTIYVPETIAVSYSDDKENWTLMTTDTLLKPSVDTLYDYIATAPERVSGRYVKFDVVKSRGWCFISEIQILRNPSGNPDMEENNLAVRKETLVDGENSKKLTDQKFATADLNDEKWAEVENEVVIDLGTSSEFEQIDVRFLHDMANGITLPESMDIFVGEEADDLKALGNVSISPLETEDATVSTYRFALGQTEKGRFVKIIFNTSQKLYIDEIEILKNQTFFAQDADEEYVDTNNIALGAAYTTSWDAMTSYPDTDKKELTDGKRGTHLYSNDAWAGYEPAYDEMSFDKDFEVVLDLGEVKEFEQVQIGTLQSNAYEYSVSVPLNIKVEYSSDKVHWNLYADKTYYNVPDGVNRMNYTLDGVKASAQYIKFTLIVPERFCLDEICVYKEMMEYGDYESDPDRGAESNLIYKKPYDVSRSADYRSTAGILTDGLYMQSGNLYDGNWTGFVRSNKAHFNEVELVFNMEAANSVGEVIISSRNDSANNLTTPKNIKLYASMDGATWDEFANVADVTDDGSVELTWNGERDGFSAKTEGATRVYTKFIKVSFEVPEEEGVYACLDEVKVIGKKGQTTDSSFVVSSTGYGNLALGKKYYSLPTSQKTAQPDIGEIQLTDGIRGDITNNQDPAWVMIQQDYCEIPNHMGSRTVVQGYVIDLGKEMYVTEVRTKFISKGFGKSTEFPWTVWTYATNDAGDECPEEWFMLSRQWHVGRAWNSGTCNFGWRSDWTGKNYPDGTPQTMTDSIKGYPFVKTRYIRVDIEALRNAALDEIEVYGYETPQEGAFEVVEGTERNLDTGRDYLKASEQTGYIQDMLLCYNGWYRIDAQSGEERGAWKDYQFRPYLTYIDKQGNAVDTMFDAVMFLGLSDKVGASYSGDAGHKYYPQSIDAWEWYLSKTLGEGGDVWELNKAAKIASEELGDPNYKVKFIVMHPGADGKNGDKFGPINGEYYDTAIPTSHYYNYPTDEKAGWQIVADWWFDRAMELYEENIKDLEYVEFAGFYYLPEQVGYLPAVPRYCVDRAHELGYKMYWIPFNSANGYHWGEDIGFDAVALQPNHFFGPATQEGSKSELGNDYLDAVARAINYSHIGLEMECDERYTTDIMKYNQWIDYLNGAYDNGMDGDNCYRNWYIALRGLTNAAYSENPLIRSAYDYAYQIMKGTYTPKNYASDYTSGVPTDRVGDTEIFEQRMGETGFVGDAYIDNASGNASNGGGGGSYYKDPVETTVETATPSDEGYVWFTGTNGYQLKDSNGEFVKGWAEVNGDWYYLDANGYMKTGWVKDQNTWYYLKSSGVMADDGWYKVDNAWYYFGSTGAMKTGWVLDNGRWYYMMSSGAMASGEWVQVNGNWYYFLGNGAMATGWVLYGNDWYYLDNTGAMATGWKVVKGEWYYLDPANGKMAKNTTVDGYKLGANGAWVK